MKKVFMIILWISVVCSTYAQNLENYSESVQKFFSVLDSLTINFATDTGYTKEFSETEVILLAKYYYRVIAEDPIGFNKYILEEYEIFKKNRLIRLNLGEMIPSLKRGIFLELLKKQLGDEFTAMVGIPYFLKVNILRIERGIYFSELDSMKFSKTNLICQILETIKGKSKFQTGDTINIFFLDRWLSCSNTFQASKKYFLPLTVRCNFNKNCDLISLQILPGEDCGILKIDNDSVSFVPGNYYNISETYTWNHFKNEFAERFIKNMED